MVFQTPMEFTAEEIRVVKYFENLLAEFRRSGMSEKIATQEALAATCNKFNEVMIEDEHINEFNLWQLLKFVNSNKVQNEDQTFYRSASRYFYEGKSGDVPRLLDEASDDEITDFLKRLRSGDGRGEKDREVKLRELRAAIDRRLNSGKSRIEGLHIETIAEVLFQKGEWEISRDRQGVLKISNGEIEDYPTFARDGTAEFNKNLKIPFIIQKKCEEFHAEDRPGVRTEDRRMLASEIFYTKRGAQI